MNKKTPVKRLLGILNTHRSSRIIFWTARKWKPREMKAMQILEIFVSHNDKVDAIFQGDQKAILEL
jgi:hypothetical protein